MAIGEQPRGHGDAPKIVLKRIASLETPHPPGQIEPRVRAGRYTARGVPIDAVRGRNQQQEDEPSFVFHVVSDDRKHYYPAAKEDFPAGC